MTPIKTQQDILAKLQIEKLNPMQVEAIAAIQSNPSVVLLSPTGTGKTLAFLLPIIADLDPDLEEVQALIIVPSRELALQIEQVVREMGTGYKVNAIYGGRTGQKDKADLKHRPAILIGTPGRIADRFRRDNFPTAFIKTLVLDEFDKSLEIGYEKEMREILSGLRKVKKRILTSATERVKAPGFVELRTPVYVDYLDKKITQLQIKKVTAKSHYKLTALIQLLRHIGNQPGIIFCNLKESIQEVCDELKKNNIRYGTFFGGMEQKDRERVLIKFRNGTHQLIVATDLAARGLDITELKFIVHYELPIREEEFTHRNGRTARMNQEGTAYLLLGKQEPLPDYIKGIKEEPLSTGALPTPSSWVTLFVSGGRKDKISKGDIAGSMMKQGGLQKDELGIIEIKQDCAFVAVKNTKVPALIKALDNTRIKKKKVRIMEI